MILSLVENALTSIKLNFTPSYLCLTLKEILFFFIIEYVQFLFNLFTFHIEKNLIEPKTKTKTETEMVLWFKYLTSSIKYFWSRNVNDGQRRSTDASNDSSSRLSFYSERPILPKNKNNKNAMTTPETSIQVITEFVEHSVYDTYCSHSN